MRLRLQTILMIPLLAAACVEQYLPPVTDVNVDYLVVDGFLNGSAGTASIILTRAIPLGVNVVNPPEENATVNIENVNGSTFALPETKEGIYEAKDLDLDETTAYRLRIHTNDGSSYTSDYIKLRKSPALDSVSWKPEAGGTRFYVSGHDAANQTKYYRYLFTETWEYRVTFPSDWKKVDGQPVFRNQVTEQVYTCWRSALSTEILTASTKKLSTDVVSMLPINFIKKGSRMLSRTYSLNVQQRAISQEEFEYWELIRKTTENLGGLFDPLPSQVIGNVHNDDDAAEQVLGYFTGGFVQEKRIFVKLLDLPNELQIVDPYDFLCEKYFVPIAQPELAGADVFVESVGIPPIGYNVAIPNCADCRSLGGDTIKPDYWPQ